MANDIKYQINVQIADNTVTKDDTDDKIFVIVSLGTADKERIIAEMMDMNPGVEPEMMRLVLDLEKRAVKRLLLNGMRVNNGLFEAVPQCRGLVRGTAWDPEANEIYVNFTQGKELREAIADVVVNVIGEKGAAMYLSSSLDAATGLGLFNATAGANLTLTGKNIKVVGDDPSVGITLTDGEGTETRIKAGAIGLNQPSKLIFLVPASLAAGAIGLNQPSKLIFLVPASLAAGDYTLTITTQFGGNSNSLLKTPRALTQTVHVAAAEEEEGGSPGGV